MYRRKVSKRRSAKSFRKRVSKTARLNVRGVRRGGIRL